MEGLTSQTAYAECINELVAYHDEAQLVMRMTVRSRDPYRRGLRFRIEVIDFDDLFQESWVAFFEAIQTYKPINEEGKPQTLALWVKLCIQNKLRQLGRYYKDMKKEQPLIELEVEQYTLCDDADEYSRIETTLLLAKFVWTLSRRQQEVFSLLVKRKPKTVIHRELAEKGMKVSLKTIWKDVYEIRAKMLQFSREQELTDWVREIHKLIPALFEEGGSDGQFTAGA